MYRVSEENARITQDMFLFLKDWLICRNSPVADLCEHGNGPSSSIKGRESLNWLRVMSVLQEGPCSMVAHSCRTQRSSFYRSQENQSAIDRTV